MVAKSRGRGGISNSIDGHFEVISFKIRKCRFYWRFNLSQQVIRSQLHWLIFAFSRKVFTLSNICLTLSPGPSPIFLTFQVHETSLSNYYRRRKGTANQWKNRTINNYSLLCNMIAIWAWNKGYSWPWWLSPRPGRVYDFRLGGAWTGWLNSETTAAGGRACWCAWPLEVTTRLSYLIMKWLL